MGTAGVESQEPIYKRTIFACFDNEGLRKRLEDLANELDCDIVWSEHDPDIIAVPYFVALVDRGKLGAKAWAYFKEFCEEVGEKQPVILLDDLEPSKYCIFQCVPDRRENERRLLDEVLRLKRFL